ncbi:MAG TPA: prenyltransferase/squalene oxidase repeat-containing protein [Tepidisphaeraceae bacterium]|nr:prenyltransferase/squalene oxidase repeat-containing protein [Tepidisphaeraceae bacterium]HEV8606429.1 prenyltransferase/squalene oxidase repeat-containing protein [Tepidisphaeraceae bacterium]
MNKMVINAAAAVVLGLGFAAGTARACGGNDGSRCEVQPPPAAATAAAPSTRPAAKPLSDQVKKGLKWLVQTQLENGAWGQGEESAQMGTGDSKLKVLPNVADTCMAVMAFVRSGNTPADGEYKLNVNRAVGFLCAQVEESDNKSLFITTLRGTRTQGKLGQYIDTFLAAQVLAEVKNQMPDESGNKRVNDALGKVIKKIEANQKEDGRWVNDGWAPTLAQAACAKALNTASVNGAKVNEQVLERAERYAQADFAVSQKAGAGAVATSGVDSSGAGVGGAVLSGRAGALAGEPRGDAGVALYSSSAQLATIQASAKSNEAKRDYYQKIADASTTQPEARKAAIAQLDRFKENEAILGKAQDAIVARLDDKQFVAGFGSNGGEEFLSHLNIGESLFHKGGADWEKWDKSMSSNLNNIQNADGSWSGHHCITGRTFCTAAALNVLTIDRSPIPAVAKVDLKK